VYGAPESFLVDGQGVIRHKFTGPLTLGIVERELKPRVAALRADAGEPDRELRRRRPGGSGGAGAGPVRLARRALRGAGVSVRAFKGTSPRIPASCFIEQSAQVIGDVELGEESSIWFNTVVRGDVNRIRIGRRTNIQDLSLVHVLKDKHATAIGDEVTVGHHVVLHGCTVGNRVLVGMGAVLMDGVVVGDDCIVAAGALLTPGTQIPPGMLAVGSPARPKGPLTQDERGWLTRSAANYVEYALAYMNG